MYIDGVVVFSLVVVALIIAIMVFIGRYAKKHIEKDVQQMEKYHRNPEVRQ